jgi:hypothetical protein
MALSFTPLKKSRAKLAEDDRAYPYFFDLREGLNDLGMALLERDIGRVI